MSRRLTPEAIAAIQRRTPKRWSESKIRDGRLVVSTVTERGVLIDERERDALVRMATAAKDGGDQ